MSSTGVDPKSIKADPKRLIVACDGTWDDSDNGMEKKHFWSSEMTPKPPSNVTRITRAILPFDPESRQQQIVYYQAGVGSENNIKDKLWGGLTGYGISEHVREAYAFLTHNYVEGDEIILLGFSRGAFTARTIGSMVSDLGLLTMRGMSYFFQIFKDWENKITKDYVSPFDAPWPVGEGKGKKPSMGAEGQPYQKYLESVGYTRRGIAIKCIGVFDTVGALGIPSLGLIPASPANEYTFVDTMVPNSVQYALQALALDEHRLPFTPTIWETPEGRKDLTLKQCWFPGVHSNIGGGYDDTMMADITLAWMASQMMKQYPKKDDPTKTENILAFDRSYITWQWDQNTKKYPLLWGCGKIEESMTGIYDLTHSLARTPDSYFETDPISGKPKDPPVPCKGTNESVHASVRLRLGLHGLGLDDKGDYKPPALENWVCEGVGGQGSKGKIRWVKGEKHMMEDQLEPLELELINRSLDDVKDSLYSLQALGYDGSEATKSQPIAHVSKKAE